jgi:hypothetical protein
MATLDNFMLSPNLPNLNCEIDVRALGRVIRDMRPVCLAIDPAYLAMRPDDARNLFSMGASLRPLADLCNSTGCTVLIVHHCKRSRYVRADPPTLDDIAWSGFAEFSAQWLMLARRRRFDPETGRHELWFSTGGRAGHHGLWALDVEEGRARERGSNSDGDESGPAGSPAGSSNGGDGRIWKTAVRRVASAQAESEERLIAASVDRCARRSTVAVERQRGRTRELLQHKPAGETARSLSRQLGVNGQRMKLILNSLVEDGLLVVSTFAKHERTETCYRLAVEADVRARCDATLPADRQSDAADRVAPPDLSSANTS